MSIQELSRHLHEGDDTSRPLQDRLASFKRAKAVATDAGIITVVEFPHADPPIKFDFIQDRIERLEFEIELAELAKNRP